jgi:hypothetical protein
MIQRRQLVVRSCKIFNHLGREGCTKEGRCASTGFRASGAKILPRGLHLHESNLPKVSGSGDDGRASGCFSDPEVNNHAAKAHGCVYAWALLPRVLLAPP